MRIMSRRQRDSSAGGVLGSLLSLGDLTFFKDYMKNTSSLNADFASGSALATFTATRAASTPATYTDASGVIQLVTTSNIPRFACGYYDATGFHQACGLLIEAAATNLVPKSYTMNDATWTATNVTVSDGAVADPAGGTNAASLTASAGNGTVLLASAVTAATYSVYLKRKTGTGDVTITADGTNYSAALTLTTSWRRFSITAVSASQVCGIKIATDTDAIYVYGNQFEAAPYSSTFIPTTAGALTRNAETLSYVTSGNRTAASETMAIKFMPMGGAFANDGLLRCLLGTIATSDIRYLIKTGAIDTVRAYPNYTDNGTVYSYTSTAPAVNTSYVISAVYQHSSPYIEIYTNGTSERTYTVGDFTDPDFGVSFYVGNATGAHQLNGLIQSVAIFSDAKLVGDVVKITNAMNG